MMALRKLVSRGVDDISMQIFEELLPNLKIAEKSSFE